MDERSTTPPHQARPLELSHTVVEALGDRLCSDLVDRWQRGERVPVEAYLRQHPELDDENVIFELVLTEVVLRQTHGDPAPLEEFRWRFPQFDERLQRHFALQSGLSTEIEPASSEGVPLSPELDASVPDYEILRELGRGGMGVVYEARDIRLDRRVALKFLPGEYANDPGRLERFHREARTTSALNHPHICTVHALGDQQGRPFIVMELIEGSTLQTRIGRPMEIEEIASIFRQAAEALAAAHAEGVVHRDIKPDNIMVRDDGYVKVLDFGLARRLPTLLSNSGEIACDTDPGALLGTVGYMSPEQVHGQPANSASDIFSLGVVLYECAGGRHPFEAETAMEKLQAVTRSPHVPPSRFNPTIPKALEAIIDAMLHKDGRLRPTADEVQSALKSLTRAESPIAAIAPTRAIVHRERELDALRSAYRQAGAGRGSLLCVAGEPGIGKTTLVEDFLDELVASGQPIVIACGRCSERLAGSEAYLTVLDALGNLLRGDSSGAAARLMKIVAPTWYARVSSLAPQTTEPRSSSRASSQQALLREFTDLLQQASQIGPVVLFLDDVHWADPSTVDLLAHLGRCCHQMRLLTVVTYRPTELLLGPHPFHAVRQDLQSRGVCAELPVQFLSTNEIERYLSIAFPGHSLPVDFADMVRARTEGSPLFMADLLRYLSEQGTIAQANGRWELVKDVPDLQGELPQSVRSMIQRKLERLDMDDRRLLAAASAQGHEFDSTVVADALGLDAADVEERLEALDRIHVLVRRIRESEFPDRTLSVRYAFVHILYQQVLYNDLQPSRRAALSTAVAVSLERRQAGGCSAAAELACLYEVGRDFVRSARQFHLASQNAAHVFAHHEAVELAQHGLRLLAGIPESQDRNSLELALQTTLGMQLQVTQGFAAPDARRAYLRARDLCRHAPDSAPLFPVLWGLWLFSKVRSELTRAQEMANELQDLSNRLQDPSLALQSHQALGITAWCRGRPSEAVQHVEQVSMLYDAERHRAHAFMFGQDPAVICKGYGAAALWMLGYSGQAQRQSDVAIQMSRELSPSSQAVAFHFAAMLHQFQRDPTRALECATQSTAISLEHGFPFWLAGGRVLRGWALAASGSAEEGLELLETGLCDWNAINSVTYLTYFLGLRADTLHRLHRTEEGLRTLDEGLALAARTGEYLYAAELHRLKGELFMAQSPNPKSAAQAESCFREALTIARQQLATGFELRAATSAAHVARRLGRTEDARAILAPILGRINEGHGTPDYREASALFDGLPESGI